MECKNKFLIAHRIQCSGCLVVITLLLIVTIFTVITAYLYWRCCCFLSSDCLICEVNIQLNAGARRKLLIWKRGRVGQSLKLNVICVEFNNYVIKLCH